MPFADYSSFEDCVRSNSDKRDAEAYCAVIKRQTEGKLDYSEEELLALKDTLDLNQTEFMKALVLLEDKLDPDEISVGDWVSWQWDGTTVRGKVTGGAKEERTASGNTLVGEEGVADVFEIEEWDDETESMGSRVVKPASSLSEAEKPASFDSKAELTEEERTPPETAQDNAQTALDARDDVGGDCGTDTGWARANQLASGEPLSEDTIERMAQFNRHRDNSEMDDDEGRADCGWQMWKSWGGDEGIDWAIRMSDRMDEIDTE